MKAHIRYNLEEQVYECWCRLTDTPSFITSVGTGATPKEAYLDWYYNRLEQLCGVDSDYIDPVSSLWEPF
jgi:hypothetical protein